jgi:hypothetical protein
MLLYCTWSLCTPACPPDFFSHRTLAHKLSDSVWRFVSTAAAQLVLDIVIVMPVLADTQHAAGLYKVCRQCALQVPADIEPCLWGISGIANVSMSYLRPCSNML